MIHKDRYNRRKRNYFKSKRKVDILKNVLNVSDKNINSTLSYSKAKIHCSCDLCSIKSKHVGNKKVNRPDTWRISDRRNFERTESTMRDYLTGDYEI